MKLLRVRFKTGSPDPRPLTWPIPHPCWITGGGEGFYTIVAYASDLDYIQANWPEAFDVEYDEAKDYIFTDRFPKPDWFKAA